MSFSTLARRKQDKLTGGNVNYYLTELPNGTVVETEDIIEHFNMEFALASSFKSTDRLCKERMGLGKPGSTPEYETGKIAYYNRRTTETSRRAEAAVGWLGKLIRWVRDHPLQSPINDHVIHITQPKRLEPYSFVVKDYIDALQPTHPERWVLENIFDLARARKRKRLPRKDEVRLADISIMLAAMFENSSTNM